MKDLLTKMELLEQENRMAIEKWLIGNPDSTINDISQNTTVEIDGKIIRIGQYVYNIRLENVKLTEERCAYWVDGLGLIIGKRSEAVELKNRKALEKWLSEDEDNNINQIDNNVAIEVDGEIINIGKIVNNIRLMKVRLTKERKKYWVEEQGLLMGSKSNINETKKRKALECWLRDNPDSTINDISQNTTVEVDGEKINIGMVIKKMRLRLTKLTKEKENYWIEEQGLVLKDEDNKEFVKVKK